MLEEYSEILYNDLLKSETTMILTLGEIAKDSLNRMKNDERFAKLKEIKIINLPYPRGNLKDQLFQELGKVL